MNEITFALESNEELWEIFDKRLNSIFIHQFNPNSIIEWWRTDLKTKNGVELKDLKVRNMQVDVQTDLNGLKKIIELNTHHLSIYQFEKPLPDTLVIDYLPEKSRDQILKQNGLRHHFFIDYEFVTIASFDAEFLKAIETNPQFKGRIIKNNLLSD